MKNKYEKTLRNAQPSQFYSPASFLIYLKTNMKNKYVTNMKPEKNTEKCSAISILGSCILHI